MRHLVKSIFVKPSNTKDKKRAWDKRHVCVFCQKSFPKLPRHLEDKHKGESEVMKMKALVAVPSDSEDTKKFKSKMRLDIIESLRRKGNYNHNISPEAGFWGINRKKVSTTRNFLQVIFHVCIVLNFTSVKIFIGTLKSVSRKATCQVNLRVTFKAIQQCFCQRILTFHHTLHKYLKQWMLMMYQFV